MKRVITIALVLTVLGASGLGANLLISEREEPKKKERVQRGVAVETVRVSEAMHRLDVRANGVVVPARDLDVFPQVTGRVVWLYKNLVPGTFVKRGQKLFRIDAHNYKLQVDQQEAELLRAESALKLEQGQQKIARSELELLQRGSGADRSDLEDLGLALREPQLEAAKGEVARAEAGLEAARLELARTSFSASFAAVVVESEAEIGQLATPQTRLARLVGTEKFWVRVALPKERLPHVAIPGIGDNQQGSEVQVRQHVGEHVVERTGHVIRLLSNLEPGSRMARVLVEIDDPYGLDQSQGESRPYPILLDAYVDVVIEGQKERKLVELPRRALREGNVVYVYDPESRTLEQRRLEIAWRLPDSVLVGSGLRDGDQVITSPIAGAVEGMKLRNVSRTSAAAQAEEAP